MAILILISIILFFEIEAKKMDHAIQLPALLKAENLRFHVEDNDEYVELYMHIANLIQGNHQWAVWHPEEVNNMKNAWNLRYIFGNPQGFGAQSGYIDSSLFTGGLKIDVARFRVSVIKRVVAELGAAGYNISYTLSNASGFPKRPKWVPPPPLPNSFTLYQIEAMNMDPKQKGLLLKAMLPNDSPWGEERTITYEQIQVLNLASEMKKHLLQQLSSASSPPQVPPLILDVELDERPTSILITL